MNKKYSKVISLLIASIMLFSVLSTMAFAHSVYNYYAMLNATDANVELDGTNPGSVTVSLAANDAMDVYGIVGIWDVTEAENTGKLTLTSITTDVSNVKFTGMNYADVATGTVSWSDDSFSDPAVLENGTKFLNATYAVAADTPAGEYTVSFKMSFLCPTDYGFYTEETDYTATITVTRKAAHEHRYAINNDGVLSTGTCECGAVSNDAYAGFIQFAETNEKLARVIFVIDGDVLANESRGYDSFDVTVSANGKTYTVNSEDLIAYTEVLAAGAEYTAENGDQIFGFVIDFGNVTLEGITVTLTAGETLLYSGAY